MDSVAGILLTDGMRGAPLEGALARGETAASSGVIVADKPEGWTSHDVVGFVKKRIGARKVGHLGTLDPMATGVLPLVINGATRYARFLDAGPKAYTALMKLGEETDTYDREGRVLMTSDPGRVQASEIEAVLSSFRGNITQVPPMYSSVKKGGVPLYRLARKGVTVAREPKEVEVFGLDVTSVRLPYVEFSIVCSKGTYVRTIAYDAGRMLGCGAHLAALRRTRSGAFAAGESLGPETAPALLLGSVIPLDTALERSSALFREIDLGEREAASVRKAAIPGKTLDGDGPGRFSPFIRNGEMVRFAHKGEEVALAECVLSAEGTKVLRYIGALRKNATRPNP